MIREASIHDLDALVEIENRCFVIDRFSRRSFRYLLTKANSITLIYEKDGRICGYAMLLFNIGTSMARLYSIAVDPDYRKQGIGKLLIEHAELTAAENECITLRLEVRKDNASSIRLYESMGYRRFGELADYYEDHMDAFRYEKSLAPHLEPDLVRVPFYRQTLDFTCGPASLMMAMKALCPNLVLDRMLELRLWRESTTVFMTSGHGGCGPYGLGLAAYHRGFEVEIHVNESGTLFVDSVRSEEKKEVMTLVQQDFVDEIEKLPITLSYGAMTVEDIQEKFNRGGIPLVLISSYRIYQEKFPHWVVVTGFDERYIYVHDPYVDVDAGKSVTDCINMPILKKDFKKMARYGKAGQKAVLIISNPQKNPCGAVS